MSAILGGAGAVSQVTANGGEVAPNGINATRSAVDLTGMGDVRIACNNTAGSGGVTFTLQYHDGTNWLSAGASVAVSGVGLYVGAWASLPVGAQGDRELRVITDNGGQTIQPLSITLDARA